MENNIREIREKCNVFSKSIDVDFDFQENLLSYNDDLLKIIRCCVNNFVVNTDCSSGVLTIYGKSKILITYVSDSGCITTADFEEDFQKSIAVDGDYNDISSDVNVINKYSSYRVINQRRIDIHNAFALNITINAAIPVKMVDEASDILIRKESVNYLSLIGTSLSHAEFEDEAAIPADSDVIKRIINCFSSLHIEETKIIKDKMLVKAIAEFSFLYTTDGENELVKRCEKSISLSKIIDIGGIDEGDKALVNLTMGNVYAKPKANSQNELRMIELVGDICISSSVFRNVTAELSTDSYATENEITNSFSKLNLNADGNFMTDIINDKTVFSFENISIVEVVDISVNISDGRSLELSAYVRNDKSELVHICKKQELSNNSFKTAAFYVKSFDFVLNSSNEITVRYLIEYTAVQFEEKTFNILSNVQINKKITADSPALVVYFAKEQEALWDIAKKFRTSVDLIKAENELNDDVLDTRRILLIPGI